MNPWETYRLHRRVSLETPVEFINQVANDVRIATGQELDAPINLEPIYEMGKFTLLLTPGKRVDGYIVLESSGTNRITLKVPGYFPKQSWANVAKVDRQYLKFVAAHEIAHSFLFPEVFGEQFVLDGLDDRLPEEDKIANERFCEEFARQLIAPSEVISGLGIADVCNEFDTTEDIAILALSGEPMVVLDETKAKGYRIRLQGMMPGY